MDFVEQNQLDTNTALNHWYYQAKFKLLRRTLVGAGVLTPETRLADVGCGVGLFLTLLERSGLLPAGNMVGIDPAAPDGAKSIGGSVPIVREWPDRGYDLVLLMDVLEHIQNDAEALGGILERVVPGGHVFITVPAFQSLWSRHDELLGHYRRYSAGSLKTLVDRFPNLEIKRRHYFYATILPPAAVVRWVRRGAGGDSTDMAPCHPVLNKILTTLLGLEAWVAPANHLAGLTVVALCQKKS